MMAVHDGAVSFTARSTTQTAASFTRRSGMIPTDAREIGDPVGNGSGGRLMTHAQWTLWIDYDEATGTTLDDAFHDLLSRFDGHLDEFDRLRDDFDCWVQFHGSSDSEQGRFWLGSQTLQKLGRLGLELLGTVYLQEGSAPSLLTEIRAGLTPQEGVALKVGTDDLHGHDGLPVN